MAEANTVPGKPFSHRADSKSLQTGSYLAGRGHSCPLGGFSVMLAEVHDGAQVS